MFCKGIGRNAPLTEKLQHGARFPNWGADVPRSSPPAPAASPAPGSCDWAFATAAWTRRLISAHLPGPLTEIWVWFLMLPASCCFLLLPALETRGPTRDLLNSVLPWKLWLEGGLGVSPFGTLLPLFQGPLDKNKGQLLGKPLGPVDQRPEKTKHWGHHPGPSVNSEASHGIQN